MNIVLIGFKNCGKTTIGQLLAQQLKISFMDTDHLIEQRYVAETHTTLTIREIYQQKGADYFRTLEKAVIKSLDQDYHAVIATGGGSVLDIDNVKQLKKHGRLIYLFTPLEILLARNQQHPIPVFLDKQEPAKSFIQLYEQRKNLYAEAADIEIAIADKSIEAIAKEIPLHFRLSSGRGRPSVAWAGEGS